jgi:hypothetical protein
MPLSRDLRYLGSVGRSPVLGLHRAIDDRFGSVPGSRSESLRFNFRAEEAGLAVPASSSSAGCLAVMGRDHGIWKLAAERGDRNKCTPHATDLLAKQTRHRQFGGARCQEPCTAGRERARVGARPSGWAG